MSLATVLPPDAVRAYIEDLASELVEYDCLPREAALRVATELVAEEPWMFALPGQHWVLHQEWEVSYHYRSEIVIRDLVADEHGRLVQINVVDADYPNSNWVIPLHPAELEYYILLAPEDPAGGVPC